MLMVLTAINTGCLLIVAVLAARLWRVPAPVDVGVSFAAVLDAVRPLAATARHEHGGAAVPAESGNPAPFTCDVAPDRRREGDACSQHSS
jgi:hypothetical protein